MDDNVEPENIIQQAKGRARFCRGRGEVKTPDLLDKLATRIEGLERENERLRKALASVIAACDQGRMVPRPGSGVCGMTVEANIRSSIYIGVPAWPIEEARAALQGETP